MKVDLEFFEIAMARRALAGYVFCQPPQSFGVPPEQEKTTYHSWLRAVSDRS